MPWFVAQFTFQETDAYGVMANDLLPTEAAANAHAREWHGRIASLDPDPPAGVHRWTVVIEAPDRDTALKEMARRVRDRPA